MRAAAPGPPILTQIPIASLPVAHLSPECSPQLDTATALRRDLLASILDPLDEQHQQQLPGWRRGGTAAASTTVSAAAAPGSVRQRRWRRLVRAGAEAGTRQQGPPLLLEQLPQPIAPAAKRHPSAAEQRELARAAGAGDERAVAALVDANRALVHFLARRFLGKGLAREDLVSEGMLALERAARRYRPQPGRDASFGTFAAATILNGMSRALHTQSRDVRLPVHHFRDMARVRQATLELATEQLRQPDYTLHLLRAMGSQVGQSPLMQVLDQEMAAPMDQDPTQQGGVSLDGLEVLLEDEVAAEERSQLIEAELRSCLARLEPQQVSVVELRHGLDGEGLRRTWKEGSYCAWDSCLW
ncbi:hypothetical protein CHLNCDRAFT_141990 [Chlorella variabilis]|uniref:RNA polymerase sigma-70 region 2 domain-containing protein n=1 Tax=Chlorella variabilis TaxID=554065 RepID=E1Z7H3_CHLVA|nr:hypothetical protein CHLNCDRAFT_141990 [Chlorella variabilis]EFN57920.1 hypothetical protein CHLNCDRAFT_141990 [Chlorella variabilis]|eukprot:XP_005850022.1 hypothetical protein CHLNCDRAFT_141990 [Chlorella variabilis]